MLGGGFHNGTSITGYWNESEKQEHINYLELLAAYNVLQSFGKNISSCEVLLRVDNTTAVSYINRMGGVKYIRLNTISRKIWDWAEKHQIWIYASYINTKDNIQADSASRNLKIDTEYELNQNIFNNICSQLGQPKIDLFANQLNRKCTSYVSWMPDPGSLHVNAFTIPWNKWFFYAFPSFSLVPRVLSKIQTDKAKGIVVVPFWPSQFWWPLFMSLSVDKPLTIQPDESLLVSPFISSHPLWKNLSLAVVVLSGEYSSTEAFQK